MEKRNKYFPKPYEELKPKINEYFYDTKIRGISKEITQLLLKISNTRKDFRDAKQILTNSEIKEVSKQISKLTQNVEETRKKIGSLKSKIKYTQAKEKALRKIRKENSFFKEEDVIKYIKHGKNYWRF